MRLYDHTFGNRGVTGADQSPGALYFDNAEPAGPDGGKAFKKTQGRYIDSVLPGDLKDSLTLRSGDGAPVDSQRYGAFSHIAIYYYNF